MSGKEKVVILNGKRFVVGNSKIKSTKCHMGKRKKLLNKEDKLILRKKNRILNMHKNRKTKRITRKRQEKFKDKNE